MIALPQDVRSQVEATLENLLGHPLRITSVSPVGGGSINHAARIAADGGEVCFLKWNLSAPAEMFAAEADGLIALRDAAGPTGVRVPEVLGVSPDGPGGSSWLLSEFVPRGAPGRGWGETLGRALAELHSPRHGGQRGFGWERDNFIGSLPQNNAVAEYWATFWRERRLRPQLVRARRSARIGGADAALLDRLLARVADALADAAADGPSLVHGDLWTGNVYPGPAGEPVLVDPAVYRGHREVDLAMSELFGGLPQGFLDAYSESWPVDPGYRRLRRPLYQLYYLLVHVNLFGSAYLSGSLQAAQQVLEQL